MSAIPKALKLGLLSRIFNFYVSFEVSQCYGQNGLKVDNLKYYQ